MTAVSVKQFQPVMLSLRGGFGGFGLGLASIPLSNYVIRHFSCKNRVKFPKFVNFSGNNLKSYVDNHYLVLFHNYFWPQPRSSGLGLEVLVSASRFWPRLTSMVSTADATHALTMLCCRARPPAELLLYQRGHQVFQSWIYRINHRGELKFDITRFYCTLHT